MGQFGGRPRRHNKQNTRNMKGLAVVLVLGIGITQAQLKFGGDSSSSSNSGSSTSSSSSSSSSGSQPSTDTRFISTGNELVDGGILGVGAGILGGAVLSGALGNNGGGSNFNGNYNSPCGRRRRQADGDDSNTRIFGLFGGNNGCNCGRRKRRQAPGEDEVGVRFFGLENLLGGGGGSNCGCNCGYNQGYNQGSNSGFNSGYNQYPQNSNSYPSNSFQQQGQCQSNNALTFQDKYGRTHGACITADNSGRKWCYTTGGYPGCSDASPSKRFPNNPWSYQACSSSFSG